MRVRSSINRYCVEWLTEFVVGLDGEFVRGVENNQDIDEFEGLSRQEEVDVVWREKLVCWS